MFRRRHLRALGKQLTVLTMGYGDARPQDCAVIARPIFRAIAPFLVCPAQLLFVRDNVGGTIEGQFITGNTSSKLESLISVPAWPANRTELTGTIAHELHHLARWQNAGYGDTLGAALLSEGYASWFEMLMSRWDPPRIHQPVSKAAIRSAIAGWAKPFDHTTWFRDGKFGKEVGYALGHTLVLRTALGAFDLHTSLLEKPAEHHLHVLTRLERV